jgi:hypothetical protein
MIVAIALGGGRLHMSAFGGKADMTKRKYPLL